VYAVLDGARDPRVHPLALGCGLPCACLYAGAIPRALAAVAPYAIRLERGHPFTHRLLDDAWGKSWGIFGTTAVDLEAVRRHLRRFLRVQREDGKTMLFRFYDPRVLRIYLPTCTAPELATFFGPFSRFVLEDERPSRLVAFARRESGFRASKVDFGGAPLVAEA
jgi:hypothetical protein